ncbi:hypothetical protein Kfla_5709 [Kribbella flavida DSM 17836]|uniref:Uncharacterized protein n=1 Tax=Kribbella flavida (strain DSM 17836 / JCM 10339 / NBRC 14399) TaxID=479435 RepID=D2PPB8_KRIFD|nr:hypothetical protein [Kribbella flavida]ADB34714.1 hypothetical protein Kfla_5709 [Kribbella flavida DSM 17836]
MPGLTGWWAATRRWVGSDGAALWPVLAAMLVVGGSLWAGVPSTGRDVTLTTDAMGGATLQQVRPHPTGEVDPRLGAAVDALLARRGIAVRTNNLPQFLRDVAPELHDEQRQLFENLRALGMDVTYRRAELWTNYEAVRRYGLATGTFRVSMRYQISGTRLGQAATDVGYTYTVRDGRLLLVDDNDLDRAVGAGRQPWDYGPIDVVKRPNVLVVADRGRLAYAERQADETVAMARKVRKLWRGYLQIVPMVVAMRDPSVLTELPAPVTETEPARVRPIPSPAENGRPVGGWIVIRPAAQATFDSAQLTHALLHLLPVRLGDEAPRWLTEGLARYAESRQLIATGRAELVTAQRDAVRRKALGDLTRLPADDEFAATDSDDISWLAVEQLIAEVGVKAVTEFYPQVARRGYNDFVRQRLMKEYTGFTEQDLVDALRTLAR